MLEKEGIVTRTVYSEFPVRIEYALSDKGTALSPVIEELERWSDNWIEPDQQEDI